MFDYGLNQSLFIPGKQLALSLLAIKNFRGPDMIWFLHIQQGKKFKTLQHIHDKHCSTYSSTTSACIYSQGS
jgi:hypothetical protein